MVKKDFVQRFLIEDCAVRGQMVRLDLTWVQLLSCAQYPSRLRQLLAEAAVSTVLLGSGLKHQARLTLQINGSGPVSLLNVQISDDLAVRGIIRWQGEIDGQNSLSELCGSECLSLTLSSEQKSRMQHDYQGIVALRGLSIAESVQGYMQDSEQLHSKFLFAHGNDSVAGLLIQQLPDVKDENGWDEIEVLSATIREQELLQQTPERLLSQVYAEHKVRLFDSRPVRFQCGCSASRIASVLRSLGYEECVAVLKEEQKIDVTCEYCNQLYSFDEREIVELFHGEVDGSPRQIH